MNKINNIFEYVNINDCLNSNVLENIDLDNNELSNDNILNNSIIVSEQNNYDNSYSLYYKDDDRIYLLSYIIKEGNGLYNYETYHSLFFNIDNNSIKEGYNKIFTDTNFINTANDNTYNFGISALDYSYLKHEKNSISLNNDILSYFNKIKNTMYDIYEKYKDIHKKISYYNVISKTYNNIDSNCIIYDYKNVDIKFIDNYYFSTGILNNDYKNDYITLSKDMDMIYFKNLNLLNIKLSVDSKYLYELKQNTSIYENSNFNEGIDIANNNHIHAVLDKSPYNNSYFPELGSFCNNIFYDSLYPHTQYQSDYVTYTSYNSIYLANNIESQKNLLDKYGGEISVKIIPESLSYINHYHVLNYNIEYHKNEEDSTEEYNLSYSYIPYETITKYVPVVNTIKLAFDNRNITNGVSIKNNLIENSYICLMNIKENSPISITNTTLLNKLLKNNIIWYNYDKVLHYGYSISYINTRDNLYRKNYEPIFQNISTKIINGNFFKKYIANNNPIPNLDIMDFENIVASDMNSFIYSNDIKENKAYIYKFNPENNRLTIISNPNIIIL